MHAVISDTVALEAADHLSKHDPLLAPIIAAAGPCTIRPHTMYYRRLVEGIIGQQLSVKAAASIKLKFNALFGGEFPTPEQILQKDFEELKSAGLSKTKTAYIIDLSQHVADGRLTFEGIETRNNDEIIAALVAVKGIGEWTAHMFLMFALGRLDVLASGDLGVRNAVRNIYGFSDAATPEQIRDIAEKNHWHPYESVACWYLWRSLDNEPK